MVLPGSTVLVTRRTTRRHHLFAPDPAIRALFTYALAFCAERFGVLVHAVVLMSTHEHLVLTDPRGLLPDFLREMHRLVALGTKVVRKWEGAVWDPEKTSVVRLLTTQAVVEKIAYCMANPVAAGLVRHGSDWPGLTTRPAELGRAVLEAARPDVFFDPDNPQWPARAAVQLTLPPSLDGQMSLTQFQHCVAEELERQESEGRKLVATSGRSFWGADRCTRTSPYRRARSFEPVRGRNPTFAVGRGNQQGFLGAAEELRLFRDAYRRALLKWRSGMRNVAFPPGTWAMRRWHAAAVEKAA